MQTGFNEQYFCLPSARWMLQPLYRQQGGDPTRTQLAGASTARQARRAAMMSGSCFCPTADPGSAKSFVPSGGPVEGRLNDERRRLSTPVPFPPESSHRKRPASADLSQSDPAQQEGNKCLWISPGGYRDRVRQ